MEIIQAALKKNQIELEETNEKIKQVEKKVEELKARKKELEEIYAHHEKAQCRGPHSYSNVPRQVRIEMGGIDEKIRQADEQKKQLENKDFQLQLSASSNKLKLEKRDIQLQLLESTKKTNELLELIVSKLFTSPSSSKVLVDLLSKDIPEMTLQDPILPAKESENEPESKVLVDL